MSFNEDRKHRVLSKFRSFLSRVPTNDYNKWVRKVDQLEAVLNDEKFAHSHYMLNWKICLPFFVYCFFIHSKTWKFPASYDPLHENTSAFADIIS